MTMHDMSGRVMLNKPLRATVGRQRVLLRPSDLSPGMYCVLIEGAGRKVSTNLVGY